MNQVAVITGSHQADSQSLKIGNVIQQKLLAHSACHGVTLIELAGDRLPLWKEAYNDNELASIDAVRSVLQQADAFVIVTPEWNGMVPAAVKNLFLLFSKDIS